MFLIRNKCWQLRMFMQTPAAATSLSSFSCQRFSQGIKRKSCAERSSARDHCSPNTFSKHPPVLVLRSGTITARANPTSTHILTFVVQNMAAGSSDHHSPTPSFPDLWPQRSQCELQLSWLASSSKTDKLRHASKSQPSIWLKCLSIYTLLCDRDTVCPHLTRN